MRDFAQKWSPVPDWKDACIETASLSVKSVPGLHQYLVSGDLDGARGELGLKNKPSGWGAAIIGGRYSVSISRDRMLFVASKNPAFTTGWHKEGYAITRADDLYSIFEIDGPHCERIFAMGTSIAWHSESNSASMMFARIPMIVYRYKSDNCLRIHVESPFAAFFWSWLNKHI